MWQEESLVEAMLLQWWTSFNISRIFYSITSLPEIYLILSYLILAVTGGHFIAWIEAKHEQSIDQEFRYLNFDLANSFHENCCISKTISARRSQNHRDAILYDTFTF